MKFTQIAKWSVVLTLVALALSAGSVLAAPVTPGADSGHAVNLGNASGTWQLLAPGTSEWFAVTYAAGTQEEVDLATNGAGGVTFAVYTPDQAATLQSTGAANPVGAGSYNPYEPNYDYTWLGHPAVTDGSTYYVVVTNTNNAPTGFQINLTVASLGD
jgi:hypothetical protein